VSSSGSSRVTSYDLRLHHVRPEKGELFRPTAVGHSCLRSAYLSSHKFKYPTLKPITMTYSLASLLQLSPEMLLVVSDNAKSHKQAPKRRGKRSDFKRRTQDTSSDRWDSSASLCRSLPQLPLSSTMASMAPPRMPIRSVDTVEQKETMPLVLFAAKKQSVNVQSSPLPDFAQRKMVASAA
jgi:hypothetical protein